MHHMVLMSMKWKIYFDGVSYLFVIFAEFPAHSLSARLRSDMTSTVGMITFPKRQATKPKFVDTVNIHINNYLQMSVKA